MSLSDCPKCWDTPCTCGHMGYETVPLGTKAELDKLKENTFKLDMANKELARWRSYVAALEAAYVVAHLIEINELTERAAADKLKANLSELKRKYDIYLEE